MMPSLAWYCLVWGAFTGVLSTNVSPESLDMWVRVVHPENAVVFFVLG
jgi:hypothetical protein